MRHKRIIFPDASGSCDIHAQIWLPDRPPQAILQVAHGLNEYGGRYAGFAAWLSERGVALAVHDHMGHGETAGEREKLGLFAPKNGWLYAINDIRNFSALLRRWYPHTPLFLLGHSMGSFMVRDILIRYDDAYDGILLSGTCHFPVKTYIAALLACDIAALRHGRHGKSRTLRNFCFGGYARRFRQEASNAAWLSRDPALHAVYAQDPYCRFTPKISMFREVFQGMRHMDRPRNFRRMRKDLPLLLFSGDADGVGGMGRGVSKAYRLFHQAGLRDVELLLYPGGRHIMLAELNKLEVYEDIYQWLLEHLPQT